MARPIESTPALKGKEAEEFIRNMIKRAEGKPTKKDMEIFKKIMFMSNGKPRCYHCGKEMFNVLDRTSGEISRHLWKCDCSDFPKHIILAEG